VTPLADGYREEPYWWSEAPTLALPRRGTEIPALPSDVDVVIVGGGYTGMMAAARLAWRGRSVALLEKNELGSGASTRNGGMVHPGFKLDLAAVLKRDSVHGRERYQASLDAFNLVEETISANQIDCDYVRTGHLELAHKASHVPQLEEKAHLLSRQFSVRARVIPRGELASEVGTSLYHGALLCEPSGGLDPAKYFAGLTRVARVRGAHLYDHTPATNIEARRRGGFEVTTPRGVIETRDVLVATNGYSDRLLPWLRRRVIPIGSYIIATPALSDGLVRSTIPNRRMLFDSKNFLHYWRLTTDNRLLFGGRASFAPTTIARARDWLYAAMLEIHPQLAGTPVEYAWGGKVGFTVDRTPHIGRVTGITYALGYCGIGVAMSTYFGHLAADWIAGGELPACWQRSFPAAPFYREQPWFLPAVGWYYAALDRL
jgi:glycine/D-amino acid oxidase-like deaminating enzyme